MSVAAELCITKRDGFIRPEIELASYGSIRVSWNDRLCGEQTQPSARKVQCDGDTVPSIRRSSTRPTGVGLEVLQPSRCHRPLRTKLVCSLAQEYGAIDIFSFEKSSIGRAGQSSSLGRFDVRSNEVGGA